MTRQAFEAWLNPGRHAGNVSQWVKPGCYEKETHQLAWLAWQAATAAALERAAEVCVDISAHQLTFQQRKTAATCAEAIRALKEQQ